MCDPSLTEETLARRSADRHAELAYALTAGAATAEKPKHTVLPGRAVVVALLMRKAVLLAFCWQLDRAGHRLLLPLAPARAALTALRTQGIRTISLRGPEREHTKTALLGAATCSQGMQHASFGRRAYARHGYGYLQRALTEQRAWHMRARQ